MTTTTEALELFETHRAEMLAVGRKAAVDLFNETGKPITADDVFVRMRDQRLLSEAQLAMNGRWIAAVFRYSGSPWIRVGSVNRSYVGRERCNATRRSVWSLRPMSVDGEPFTREAVVAYLAGLSEEDWNEVLTEAAHKALD